MSAAGDAPNTSAASVDEASAAQTDMARLAKAASETKGLFYVPMDETTKAAALNQPGGVTQAVDDLGSPAQQALLKAARDIDLTKAGSSVPDSLAAKQAASKLERALGQRIRSLTDIFTLGRPDATQRKISDRVQGMSRSFREEQLNLASRIQSSPEEKIAAARRELDKQCELLAEDAKAFSSLAKNDQNRLAHKWMQALSLAAKGRIDVLEGTLSSGPAMNYFNLLNDIEDFRKIEDDKTRKRVLTDAQNAKRTWPTYAEGVHRDAWTSWADVKGALELSKLAEGKPDTKQLISVLLRLMCQQIVAKHTRFELKPPPSIGDTVQEVSDQLDETLRNLVDKPDIHLWQDSFSGEFAEVIKEASNFADAALSSLTAFTSKMAILKLEPMARVHLMRELELSHKKLTANETTVYARVMVRMAHMAHALKAELEAIDARVADQSQDSKGKGHGGSTGNPELRLQLQTLVQPLNVIEATSRELLSLLAPNLTEEDFGKLARFEQATDSDASSTTDTDDIGDTHPTSSVPEPALGAVSGGAAKAEAPLPASTLREHLESLKPPELEDMMPQKSVDPITFQEMKAVLDPFFKKAKENWSTALVALNNHHLANFDRKKRQQLLGCSNELQQARAALEEARTVYNNTLTKANKNSTVQRKFSPLEDQMLKIKLYKKAERWVRNWANNPASLSFTERVKQGHLQPRFGRDSSDEGFCFHTSYGWTVEALAPQAPITRWDGRTEYPEDLAFHFHFSNDPTGIPMSKVTKDMLTVMTVKQKGDRFVTHRRDANGEMQHVPEVVLPQDDAWEVFKRVVQPAKTRAA